MKRGRAAKPVYTWLGRIVCQSITLYVCYNLCQWSIQFGFCRHSVYDSTATATPLSLSVPARPLDAVNRRANFVAWRLWLWLWLWLWLIEAKVSMWRMRDMFAVNLYLMT